MSGIPSEELSTVFKDAELYTMRNIVQLTKQKLEPIHAYLEAELSALNHQEP
jgi:hypothetical protein